MFLGIAVVSFIKERLSHFVFNLLFLELILQVLVSISFCHPIPPCSLLSNQTLAIILTILLIKFGLRLGGKLHVQLIVFILKVLLLDVVSLNHRNKSINFFVNNHVQVILSAMLVFYFLV